jgi:hypothetical protein
MRHAIGCCDNSSFIGRVVERLAFAVGQAGVRKNRGEALYESDPLQNDELLNKLWTMVISAAPGYFQRGNWLVVEFDG